MGVKFGDRRDVLTGWLGYDGRKLPPSKDDGKEPSPKVVPEEESKEIVKAWRPLFDEAKEAKGGDVGINQEDDESKSETGIEGVS